MKETIQFLKELQHELKTQETDCQAAPRYWAIMDYKWEVTQDGYHDREILYFNDSESVYTVDEYLKEVLEENDWGYTEEEIAELQDMVDNGSDSYEVAEWIKETTKGKLDVDHLYEREIEFVVPNTMFLTKEDAKKHLELNHYHYSKKAHTYAMTAWRSPKVDRLLNILETFDWDSVIIK